MAQLPKVVVVQMCSGSPPEANYLHLESQLASLSANSLTLVCLPEAWLAMCNTAEDTLQLSQNNWQWVERLKQLCKTYHVWLAAGTIALPFDEGRYSATSLLIDSEGTIIAQYNKIHLFDVQVDDGVKYYDESANCAPGDEVVVVNSPFGKIGLSVCYDLRFPGIYQKMMHLGAELIMVPSAFTTVTGAAHWRPLLQARAIETQSYVIAAAQTGTHENGRKTFGHSLIVSPWGTILADAGEQCGMIQCNIDLDELMQIRNKMPVQAHNRFKSEFYE